MAAFTSYHHPPFLVDSFILPPKPQTPINGNEILPLQIKSFDHFDPLSNVQVCDEDGFSHDHASGIQSSSVEQQSSCCEKQRTDSFASMAESVEQNTNYLGIVDKKRKIGNGFSSNSKDVVKQVKSKKEKADKEGIKDEKKDTNQGTEQPPKEYIHVRAKRGQATDSHSLAERVRREKISERMKTLQALVPGCDKVTGKAMMLDEIINYVQSLQNQVEFLSMKLASLDPMVYTFGLMDVDLPIRFEGLLNNMGSPPLPPLVQLPTTTTSSTSGSGSGTQPLAFPDANAVVSFTSTAAASAPTTTTFPCATVDSLARLIQQDQKLLLPTQESRSSHWAWGVLDEEQRQSNNIINHFSLGSNTTTTTNLYTFH